MATLEELSELERDSVCSESTDNETKQATSMDLIKNYDDSAHSTDEDDQKEEANRTSDTVNEQQQHVDMASIGEGAENSAIVVTEFNSSLSDIAKSDIDNKSEQSINSAGLDSSCAPIGKKVSRFSKDGPVVESIALDICANNVEEKGNNESRDSNSSAFRLLANNKNETERRSRSRSNSRKMSSEREKKSRSRSPSESKKGDEKMKGLSNTPDTVNSKRLKGRDSVSKSHSRSRERSHTQTRRSRERSCTSTKRSRDRSRTPAMRSRERSKERSRTPVKRSRERSRTPVKRSRERSRTSVKRSRERSRTPIKRRSSSRDRRNRRRDRSGSSDRYKKSRCRSSSRERKHSRSRRRDSSRSRSPGYRRGSNRGSNRRNSRNRSPRRRVSRSRSTDKQREYSRTYRESDSRSGKSKNADEYASDRNRGDYDNSRGRYPGRRDLTSSRDEGDSQYERGGRGGWRGDRESNFSRNFNEKSSSFQQDSRGMQLVRSNENFENMNSPSREARHVNNQIKSQGNFRPIPSLMAIECKAPADKSEGDTYDPTKPTDDDCSEDSKTSKQPDRAMEAKVDSQKKESFTKLDHSVPLLPNIYEPPPMFFPMNRPLLHAHGDHIVMPPQRHFGSPGVRPSVELLSGPPLHLGPHNNMTSNSDMPPFIHGAPSNNPRWRPVASEGQPPQPGAPFGVSSQIRLITVPRFPPPLPPNSQIPGMPHLSQGIVYHPHQGLMPGSTHQVLSLPPTTLPPPPSGPFPSANAQNQFNMPPGAMPPGLSTSGQPNVSNTSGHLLLPGNIPLPQARLSMHPSGIQTVPGNNSVASINHLPLPQSQAITSHYTNQAASRNVSDMFHASGAEIQVKTSDVPSISSMTDASGAPLRSSYDARENESDVTSEEDENLADSSPIAVFRNDSAREFAASVSAKPWHNSGKPVSSSDNGTITRVYGSLACGPRIGKDGDCNRNQFVGNEGGGKSKVDDKVAQNKKDNIIDDCMEIDDSSSGSCSIVSNPQLSKPKIVSFGNSQSTTATGLSINTSTNASTTSSGFTMPQTLRDLFNSAGISHALVSNVPPAPANLDVQSIEAGRGGKDQVGPQSTLRAHVAPMPQSGSRPHAAVEPQAVLKSLGDVPGGLDLVKVADLKRVLDSVRTVLPEGTVVASASSTAGGGLINANVSNMQSEGGSSSAADMGVNKQLIQEIVVEEVKLALKPHYSKGNITKDEYKDIMRRAVPKICHSAKGGHVVSAKVQDFIDQYVDKIAKHRKAPHKH